MDLMNPPSGPFVPVGIAQISAPVAFVDGTPKSVPFDVLPYNKGSALRFPSPAIPDTFLGCGPGVYLVQAQFSLSSSPTTVLAQLVMGSGSFTRQASSKWAAANAGALTLNCIQLNSYSPLQVDNIFAGLQLIITGTGAGGNITLADLFLFRLGQA